MSIHIGAACFSTEVQVDFVLAFYVKPDGLRVAACQAESSTNMQDPNADTEWNDVLRAKGILGPKQEAEVTEDQLARMVEDTIQSKSQGKQIEDMTLDELEELEDEESEQILLEFR